MREHVFSEVDKNKDFLISMEEFAEGTQGDNYEKDEGWKTVDDEEVRTLIKPNVMRKRGGGVDRSEAKCGPQDSVVIRGLYCCISPDIVRLSIVLFRWVHPSL